MGWASNTWHTIHYIALGYPLSPTDEERDSYKQFFQNIHKVLPCEICSENYQRHLKYLRLDDHLNSKRDLFNWTVKLHNIVNAELGKMQWPLNMAWHYYATNDTEYFTTYCMAFVGTIIFLIAIYLFTK